MKRRIIKTIFLSILVLCMMFSVNQCAAKKRTLGDINQDNKVDSIDQILIMRHIMASARNTHPEWILKGDKLKLADLTENGKVDNSDMLKILRYIAAKRNPEKIGRKHKEWLELGEIEETVEVTGITLNETSLSLDMSATKSAKLIATILPVDATNKTVTWSTNNRNVAEVDQNGKITAKGNGTATITAKTVNGKTSTCKVTVTTSPTSVKLNKDTLSLDMSGTKTATLKSTISPSTASNKTVTYSSSNTKVATIDQKGKITAKKNGTTTITVKTNNKKSATCKVTVTTSPTSIKLNKTSIIINLDKSSTKKATATLKATIKPSTASNKTISWSSSNTKIASVKNGVVTAKGNGTVKIIAKTNNNKKAECRITVQNLKIKGGQAIAEAAVQLACTVYPENKMYVAWPNTRIYNNRTKEYVNARESLIKGKNMDGGDYASCDMGVATAVRYSGVDKNMEYRTIPNIWTYLKNSKEWKIVGTYNGTTTKNLEAGDVLINNHHILIYTGNSVVKKKYPKSTADIYESGYGTYYNGSYYPALYKLSLKHGDSSENPYTIFKNVNADKKIYNKILK